MQDRIFLGLSLRRRIIHVAWVVYYLVFVLIWFAIRRSIPSVELIGLIFVPARSSAVQSDGKAPRGPSAVAV